MKHYSGFLLTFACILTALLMSFAITSCADDSEAGRVAESLKKGDTPSKSDFTVMIEYCGRYASEAQIYQDKINNYAASSPEAVEASEKLSRLTSERPYLTLFFNNITRATRSQLGPDNVRLIEKYAPLEWFSAPDWALILPSGEPAGMMVEMPENDTSAVIAAGVNRVEISEN